jgi:transcriptional regulator with XRE-family HTH domain
MEPETNFGEWLRQQRKINDLTLEELARRAGCSSEMLRKIEKGFRQPSKDLRARLVGQFEGISQAGDQRGDTFGPWLRRQRKTLLMTQADLGQLCGVAGDTIQKIEVGMSRPSKQVAMLLAEALNIPPVDRLSFIQWARGVAQPPLSVVDNRIDSPHPTQTPQLSRPILEQVQAAAPIHLPPFLTPLIGRERDLYPSKPLLRWDLVRESFTIARFGFGDSYDC